MERVLNRYHLAKPTVRMVIEWPLIIVVGILGEVFSWARLPLSPYSHVLGGAALTVGAILHALCHRAHRRAHDQSEQIEGLVTTGLFSKMHHPIYTTLIEDAVMFASGIYSLILLLMSWRTEGYSGSFAQERG